jgi:hypothetical protein
MKRLFLAACIAVCALVSSAFAADPMGTVQAVEGRPVAAGPSGSRPLDTGSDVFEGDTVTVGAAGNAQIELDDGTRLVVGPSSRLVLQAYLRRNASTARKVGVKALRGTFRVITGNSPKSAYDIKTSNATIGIRGTEFDFTVTDKTLIAVLGGAVRLRGQNGQVVETQAGCGVAEAGGGIAAQALSGEQKANALNNDLPYITDQSPLSENFRLPVQNCLTSLGSNEGSGSPGLSPQILVPVVPALAIPATILLLDDKEEPVSADGTAPTCPLPPGATSCIDNCNPNTCVFP